MACESETQAFPLVPHIILRLKLLWLVLGRLGMLLASSFSLGSDYFSSVSFPCSAWQPLLPVFSTAASTCLFSGLAQSQLVVVLPCRSPDCVCSHMFILLQACIASFLSLLEYFSVGLRHDSSFTPANKDYMSGHMSRWPVGCLLLELCSCRWSTLLRCVPRLCQVHLPGQGLGCPVACFSRLRFPFRPEGLHCVG